jgi:Ca-activated chloride channel family protein
MMLVVDVSRSMMVEDFLPNRLDRTRYAMDKLFASLNQDRVGVVVFAGEAKVQLPITSDYRMARSFARRLSTDLVGVQGTELGEAIDLASLSFSDREGASRVMVLITDGEAHDSGAVAAAERAAERGIRIFTIGIGSPEGAPIKIGGELVKDEKGEMVVSRLNEELLQTIAQKGNGGYIRASNAEFGLSEIVNEIEKMEKTELSTLRFDEYNEQFYWILWVVLGLLLLEGLLLDRRNPRLRRFNIFEK